MCVVEKSCIKCQKWASKEHSLRLILMRYITPTVHEITTGPRDGTADYNGDEKNAEDTTNAFSRELLSKPIETLHV